MSNTTSIIFSPLCIIFLLLLQTSHGDVPIFHTCSVVSSPPTSQYKDNLNTLLATLTTTTPPTGFSHGSIPPYANSSSSAATTYGLALCRGDITTTDCESCLANITTHVHELCPDNKAGIIWYENCLLKYSDENFFGRIDTHNNIKVAQLSFYYIDTHNNTSPDLFCKEVKDLLLNQLVKEAVSSSEKKLYAASEVKLDMFTNLYGLVQCTRDLSVAECGKCLDEIVGGLPDSSDAMKGRKTLTGSCNYMYELKSVSPSSSSL